eukprot:jgi/Chrzof1/12953/Cz07g13220.t1
MTGDGKTYYYNKRLNTSKWDINPLEREALVAPLNPYDNEIVMPLAEFVKHPIADELLHDGQAFQVLGLTNYSHWQHSAAMRSCIHQQPSVADDLLTFAKERVMKFTHVGTTDMLYPSVESCAASLNLHLDGPAYGAGENVKANIENQVRALTWDQVQDKVVEVDKQLDSIRASPSAQDDPFYGSSTPVVTPADEMHSLAAAVRRSRQKVAAMQQKWNSAVQAKASQKELAHVRHALNVARADLRVKQDDLVTARSQEQQRRDREAKEGGKDKMLELALGAEFQRCASKAQGKNKMRKTSSLAHLALPDGRQVEFAKAARKQIPDEVIQEIKRRNALDIELHHLARQLLLDQRKQHEAAGRLQQLPNVSVNPGKVPARVPTQVPLPDHKGEL